MSLIDTASSEKAGVPVKKVIRNIKTAIYEANSPIINRARTRGFAPFNGMTCM
jgi:hypothetical protein